MLPDAFKLCLCIFKLTPLFCQVYAWSSGSSDRADFYYASDVNNVNWVHLSTIRASRGGLQNISVSYTLPAGSTQAIRVQFRYGWPYGPETTACKNGSWSDRVSPTNDAIFIRDD